MYNYLLIKTDKDLNITTAKVVASDHINALGFVSEVDFDVQRHTGLEEVYEDLALYPDDIQAVECSRWIGQYDKETEDDTSSWLCFDCEEYMACCCCEE